MLPACRVHNIERILPWMPSKSHTQYSPLLLYSVHLWLSCFKPAGQRQWAYLPSNEHLQRPNLSNIHLFTLCSTNNISGFAASVTKIKTHLFGKRFFLLLTLTKHQAPYLVYFSLLVCSTFSWQFKIEVEIVGTPPVTNKHSLCPGTFREIQGVRHFRILSSLEVVFVQSGLINVSELVFASDWNLCSFRN